MERLGPRALDAWIAPREVRLAAGALSAQGYNLTLPAIGPGTLEFADDAGKRHGLATLHQLRALAAAHAQAVPAVRIDDAPAMPVRGVMIDVSRTRVPTMQALFALVEDIAALKGNHLQLYTEHAFAYRGHEEAWRGSGAITPSEVRALDAHARRFGVTLAANQNCFGHLARWLRLPKYQHLAETHGDWVFDVWPRSGPFSLCPVDPASLDLVRDWLDQLLPCFSSGLVNIGCDETYDVGFGRSAEAVRARGRGAVYAEFVNKVAREALARGSRPMFWSDIALHDPSCLTMLPRELIALAWGYEPDTPFEAWLHTLREAGLTSWVCPGTSSWRSILGRTRERTANLQSAASAGAGAQAAGMLVCDWGDTGHHQPWPVSWHGLRQGLALAWNPEGGDRALRHEPLARWLDEAGDLDVELRAVCGRLARADAPESSPLRNQSALFIDLHNLAEGDQLDVGRLEHWAQVCERLQGLRSSLAGMRPELDAATTEELAFALDYLDVAARRALARRQPGGLSESARAALRDRWAGVMSDHARLWPVRSRPEGLDESLEFMRKVAAKFA